MKNRRSTKQRQLIQEAVEKRHDHPTADQIYLDVRAADERVSRGTVYRNLGILSASGQISNVKVPAADRFDSRRRNKRQSNRQRAFAEARNIVYGYKSFLLFHKNQPF